MRAVKWWIPFFFVSLSYPIISYLWKTFYPSQPKFVCGETKNRMHSNSLVIIFISLPSEFISSIHSCISPSISSTICLLDSVFASICLTLAWIESRLKIGFQISIVLQLLHRSSDSNPSWWSILCVSRYNHQSLVDGVFFNQRVEIGIRSDGDYQWELQ